jgi:plasmid replication initiation protein
MGALQKLERNQLEHPAGERWVSMTNALARAGAGLTLAEKRLVMAAVAKLDSRRYPQPGECPCVKITAAEYAETFGVSSDMAYKALRSASKALFKRVITFYDDSYKRTLTKRKRPPVTTEMHWIGEAKYHEQEGWVELHFWHRIVPHLMGLRKQFTTYQLEQTHALRSVYSWKLLELFSSYKGNNGDGWMDITIDDFCTSMEATEKQRGDFAAIRRKIIEPAVKELRDKDNWLIEWRAINAGRKVTGLRFVFRRNPQGRLPLED